MHRLINVPLCFLWLVSAALQQASDEEASGESGQADFTWKLREEYHTQAQNTSLLTTMVCECKCVFPE